MTLVSHIHSPLSYSKNQALIPSSSRLERSSIVRVLPDPYIYHAWTRGSGAAVRAATWAVQEQSVHVLAST